MDNFIISGNFGVHLLLFWLASEQVPVKTQAYRKGYEIINRPEKKSHQERLSQGNAK